MKPIFFALWLTVLGFCGAFAAGRGVSPEAKADFEWFQSLGYPDVKDAPWVTAWTGAYSQEGSQPPKARPIQGFLLGDKDGKFSVLQLDLRSGTYAKTQDGIEAFRRIGYEKQSFRDAAWQYLADLKVPEGEKPLRIHRQFGRRLGLKAQTFFFAYASWRKGEESQAQKLYVAAQQAEAWVSSPGAEKKAEPLREVVARELAHAGTWQAVLLFGGGDWGGDGQLASRQELLEIFRQLDRRFPENPHQERVKKTVALLEQMVGEDARHEALSGEAIGLLPVEEQVKEWIFRLRDQNGHQMGQPDWCDVFEDLGKTRGKTPAHELVEIGYPAVPLLIEALSDERFSRSVGFHRDFHFSHHVLTVGDCAQQILNRIAKRAFYAPVTTSGYMSRDDKVARTREEARKWWVEFQAKGETQSLIDGISAGDQHPGKMAEMLKRLNPESTQAALLTGAGKAGTDWLVVAYFRELSAFDSPPVREFLRERMTNANSTEVRQEAARALWTWEDDSVVPAMVKEWAAVPKDNEGYRDGQIVRHILAASGREEAVRALAAGWSERNVLQRGEIVEILAQAQGGGKLRQARGIAVRAPDAEAREEAEKFLVGALQDDLPASVRKEMPRLCDTALLALQQIFPDRYRYTADAGRRQRDAEIRAAKNAWRKSHGGAPLEEEPPESRPVLAVEDALRLSKVRVAMPNSRVANAWNSELLALQGTALTEDTVTRIFQRFLESEVTGVSGIRVELSREDDLTGVTLKVTMFPGPYPKTGVFARYHGGRAGDDALPCSAGSILREGFAQKDVWKDVERGSRQLVQAPPRTPFVFDAGVRTE